MSLPNYLQKIKSAGIYRFVWDKSEIPGEVAQTLRLCVGYSEKGPFNTPVYVESADDFKKIFGSVNRKLEKFGAYFHRMCIQALSVGPIYVLNLKNFTDAEPTANKVEAISFLPTEPMHNTDHATYTANGITIYITKEEYEELKKATEKTVAEDATYIVGNSEDFVVGDIDKSGIGITDSQYNEFNQCTSRVINANGPYSVITTVDTETENVTINIDEESDYHDLLTATILTTEAVYSVVGEEGGEPVGTATIEKDDFDKLYGKTLSAAIKYFVVGDAQSENPVYVTINNEEDFNNLQSAVSLTLGEEDNKYYIIGEDSEQQEIKVEIDEVAYNSLSGKTLSVPDEYYVIGDELSENPVYVNIDDTEYDSIKNATTLTLTDKYYIIGDAQSENPVYVTISSEEYDILAENGRILNKMTCAGYSLVGKKDEKTISIAIDTTSAENIYKTLFGNSNVQMNKSTETPATYYMNDIVIGSNVVPNAISDGDYTELLRLASVNSLFIDDECTEIIKNKLSVEDIYDTSRFWALEPNNLPKYYTDTLHHDNPNFKDYIYFSATDSKETSKTLFIRGYNPGDSYNITFKTWYSQVMNDVDMPAYIKEVENNKLNQYFMEIFVFDGQFTRELATSEALSKYFNVTTDSENHDLITLKPYLLNSFGNPIDTLDTLAMDANSNFINKYSGIILPEFVNANGVNISLDTIFNQDNAIHKMMMAINSDLLYTESGYMNEIETAGYGKLYDYFKPDSTPIQLYSALGAGITPRKSVGTVKMVDSDIVWTFDNDDYMPYGNNVTLYQTNGAGDLSLTISGLKASGTEEFISSLNFAVGDKFVGSTSGSVVTLTSISVDSTNRILTFDNTVGQFNYNGNTFIIKINSAVTYTSENMQPVYFEGYTVSESLKKPFDFKQANKLKWQQFILNTLKVYPGLREALTNNVDIEYHYLVDTFEGFVEENIKGRLSLICKEKDNCLGLLNFPGVDTLANCEYTSFTNNVNVFDMKYVTTGGNRQKPMGQPLTLPDDENGASWVAYYTPVVLQNNISRVKIICPSAALVSNVFMAKYDTRFPYSIVAGPNFARLSDADLIGPDFNYARYDLDILEPFGVNAIVYSPRRGTYINSNQTAKQTPVTTLSKVNVRELVIFIQDEIADLLQDYQWEFNTQTLRDTVKAKADVICETIKNNGGLYDYLNVCDETNNTDEVINNEMFVISTSIEPGIGAGKMVEELTLYRKGGMSSIIK